MAARIEGRFGSDSTVAVCASAETALQRLRALGVASVERLLGRGVSYGAATGQAQALEVLPAHVVGAGNPAGRAALHLARYASAVTMIVRGPYLARTMSDYLLREIRAHDRIAVRTRTEDVDGGGDGHLEWLMLRENETGERTTVGARGLFILIGAEPRTDWLPRQIERDPRGCGRTGAAVERWTLDRAPMAFETSMPVCSPRATSVRGPSNGSPRRPGRARSPCR